MTVSGLPTGDFPALSKLQNLHEINLDGGATDEQLEELGKIGFPNLAEVVLTECPKVTDKGVEAANPTGNDALQQVVNGQLDQALKGAGLEVFLTAPDVVAAGDSGHVAVSGLHVRYTQPNDNPAVPTQSVEYILGEARAFAFVVPGEGAPSVSASVGVGAGSSGPSTSGVTTNPSAAHPTATPPSSEAATAAAPSGDSSSPIALLRRKPTYLVWLYLIWQALVLATGGALLWWRRAEVVRV